MDLPTLAEREAKKRREIERLRGVPPEETMMMGFQLMRFARHLSEGAERATRPGS